MVAPHITGCYSVIIVKFLFVYLPLRDLIVIIGFYPYICLRRSVNWWLKTVIVHTDFVFTFCLIACSSASCTKSGNFWTLRLGTLENNHNTPGLSISFQFCRKLTKHLLYHIANFDGGTQSLIWSVICIFMKSTSCSSGCPPSPWTWSVLHITGVFSVSSQYTIHRSLQHLHHNDLPSLADGTFPHDKVKLPSHKKLTFGVKLCWFQLYCSKTIWSFSLIFARHVARYIPIILTIFQEDTQCLTLWKTCLEHFCKNFFPGVYYRMFSPAMDIIPTSLAVAYSNGKYTN